VWPRGRNPTDPSSGKACNRMKKRMPWTRSPAGVTYARRHGLPTGAGRRARVRLPDALDLAARSKEEKR